MGQIHFKQQCIYQLTYTTPPALLNVQLCINKAFIIFYYSCGPSLTKIDKKLQYQIKLFISVGSVKTTIARPLATKNVLYLLPGLPTVTITNGFQRTLPVDQSLHITCEVRANPVASVTWLFNGKPLNKTQVTRYKISDCNQTLRIPSVELRDTGNFTCVGINEYGNNTAVMLLSVYSKGEYWFLILFNLFVKFRPKTQDHIITNTP